MLFGKKVIVYGLGKAWDINKSFLYSYFDIIGFSDKKYVDIDGFIEKSSIKNLRFDYIYITTQKYYDEIKFEFVDKYNINKDRIISYIDIIAERVQFLEGSNFDSYNQGNVITEINRFESNLPTNHINRQNISEEPEIYNNQGTKLKSFFLRESFWGNCELYNSKYFVWNRTNYNLDNHFYVNRHILDNIGNPIRKYAFLFEPESILPGDYKLFRNNKTFIESDFITLFTFDYNILNEFNNAEFLPLSAAPWYYVENETEEDEALNYLRKTKNVSITASNKAMTNLHELRGELARKCKAYNWADAYGSAVGTRFETYEPYREYRYSIVIENSISPLYFTEKITNCFLAQTIPIYVGASNIGDYFNLDGIIQIQPNDLNNIESVLRQCTECEYISRKKAILDNYKRVKKFCNIWDYMYEKYVQQDLVTY